MERKAKEKTQNMENIISLFLALMITEALQVFYSNQFMDQTREFIMKNIFLFNKLVISHYYSIFSFFIYSIIIIIFKLFFYSKIVNYLIAVADININIFLNILLGCIEYF